MYDWDRQNLTMDSKYCACVCVTSVYDKLAVLSLWTVVLSPPLLTCCSYSPYSGYLIDRAELHIAAL